VLANAWDAASAAVIEAAGAPVIALAASLPLPLNVLLAPGRGPTIAELTDAGVRRVSVGHLIAAAAYATVKTATKQLLVGGDAILREGIPHPDMQQLLRARAE
jgi:2-methylisocitrate lyase-like PEP mutase family enzyme